MKIRVFLDYEKGTELRYRYEAESVPNVGEHFWVQFGDWTIPGTNKYNSGLSMDEFVVTKREWSLQVNSDDTVIPEVDITIALLPRKEDDYYDD